MSWDTEFEDLMTQEVGRRPYSGQNEYGEPSYGATQMVKCRIVQKPTIIRTGGGGEISASEREVVSNATIYCAGVIGWAMRDGVVLPNGDTPVILDIRRYPDEDGDHHEVVLV